MSNIHCFTSINFGYLAKARILASTLKKHHPNWVFILCVTDKEPKGFHFKLEEEPFDDVIWAHNLPINNFKSWIFKHNVVEACTAVKGPVFKLLSDQNCEKIIYIDPDVAVFNSLDEVISLLNQYDIILTPHQIDPEIHDLGIKDNEICSLKHGIYNLGFLAVNNSGEGKRFINWWNERLLNYCYDDIPNGLFVDQKWCDLVPAFFNKIKILRHYGYNVASWNISNRKILINQNGQITVNNENLIFYHFTKIESIGFIMTLRYSEHNIHIFELYNWYMNLLDKYKPINFPNDWWHYGKYDNDKMILDEHRKIYRQRIDLQNSFPNPFQVTSDSYYQWLINTQEQS